MVVLEVCRSIFCEIPVHQTRLPFTVAANLLISDLSNSNFFAVGAHAHRTTYRSITAVLLRDAYRMKMQEQKGSISTLKKSPRTHTWWFHDV